jgi:hypothetical protein
MPNFTLYPGEWEDEEVINDQPSTALMVVDPEKPQMKTVESQQFPHHFAPEKFFQCIDIEESTQICEQDFSYTRAETFISQISMDEDLSLLIDGQRYRPTEKAHGDLCKVLGIPIDFAFDIPTDLTAVIVQRLKREHQQAVVMVAREGTIVSFIDPVKGADGKDKPRNERKKKKPHYQPLSNLSFLHMLEKVWSGTEIDTRITISDSGVQVELLYLDDAFNIEHEVGDITRVGIAISNSETGGPLPLATGYAFRLKCTNGNKIRDKLADVRFSGDWRCTWDNRCDRFTADLKVLKQRMHDKFGDLQTAYRRMVDERLDDKNFYSWYRQAEYLFRGIADRSTHIDNIFGVEPDQRKEIFNRERQRRRELKDANTTVIEPPQSTDLHAWNVFNGITAAARDEVRYQRRTALEMLGSDVLQSFLPPTSKN